MTPCRTPVRASATAAALSMSMLLCAGPAPAAEDRPSANISASLHGDVAALNNDSRLMDRGARPHIETEGTYLETRLSATGPLPLGERTRWFFRSYTISSQTSPSAQGLRSRVDEAFADWKSDAGFLALGKRRVNWGHALAFNPVNVIAPPRNPQDPSFETEGQPMLWLGTGSRPALDLVFTQGNTRQSYSGDRPRWGLRAGLPTPEADIALYAFDGGRLPDGKAFSRMLGASFSMNAWSGTTLYGEWARFSTNDRTYYAAGGSAYAKPSAYSQVVIGSQLDLGGRSNAFAEVFFNGAGYSARERSRYLQALDRDIANGAPQGLSKDFMPLSLNRLYALIGYRAEFREKFGGAAGLLGARDGSLSLRLDGSYAASDYVEFKLSYACDAGSRGTEFGNSVFRSVLQLQLSASY